MKVVPIYPATATWGMLNVYILRHTDAGWQVLERHENVDAMGSNGQIGSIKWVAVAPDRQGFIVSSGGIWQGYVISFADIYDLRGGLRHLGGFKEMSSNEGACGPDTGECWDISSTIHFVDSTSPSPYRDVLIEFKGKRYTVTNAIADV